MMKERLLTNTEPIDVFHYFEDLTFIPRESGNLPKSMVWNTSRMNGTTF